MKKIELFHTRLIFNVLRSVLFSSAKTVKARAAFFLHFFPQTLLPGSEKAVY
jgi:hypothetical protein